MSEPTRTSNPEAGGATRTAADTGGADLGAATDTPPGYELLSEVGSGGMGVVYRARDLDLGREVAVKILQSRYSPDSPTARRFVDEARITGRLQHPGIPAIYRVGTLADGRPFLAMKLIGGRTLDELLKEPADPEPPAAGLGPLGQGWLDRLDDFLRRGRFLAVFEHVCQAVGYAHRQDVIHRDLKPSNVMVGDFGEVQVLDWGIARSGERRPETAVGEDGKPAATVEYTPGSPLATPQSDLTQAGSILGTPAFMPPEQAIGAIDQIGKHSDVFGLGAILCVILTGKPPYAAADAESNRQLAARGKLDEAFARLDAAGAEPDLVALAKRCLAVEPKDRPRDAGEVAEAVAGLRADAERRARQAEMDRAKAEVQAAEEYKRRKVKRALTAAVAGLVAVAAVAGWWIDRERTQRAAEREAEQFREVAAANARAAELREQRTAYERDVKAAVNEVQLHLQEGRDYDENLDRWLGSLASASFPLQRAQKLLESGDPGDELRRAVSAVETAWVRDNRDRLLLVELDRVADANEIRLLMPMSFTSVTARQYAAAFRKHGIDLLAVPTGEAAAWLRNHRLRERLVVAIRNWHRSYPGWGLEGAADLPLLDAVQASAAVAGAPVVVGLARAPNRALEKLLRKTSPHAKLAAILDAVTDDPFVRDWWAAVEKRDVAKLGDLVRRPEVGRMSSRQLASLTDGLNFYAGTSEVLDPLLDAAYERFPGEFWVHFRMAFRSHFARKSPDPDRYDPDETRRHLVAAVAIRPNSAVARAALGMELLASGKGDPAGLRMLRSAAKADPASPWPHLFIGMHAVETADWPEAFRAFADAVRADPDVGYFMTSSAAVIALTSSGYGPNPPAEDDVRRFLDELIAIHPRHPGGHDVLGKYHLQTGDHRAALAAFREAREFVTPDYPGRSVLESQVRELEAEERWPAERFGEDLPAVLRGEITPAGGELAQLASYCATFEKKFALASRLAEEAVKADPRLLDHWAQVAKHAGWAVQAAAGNGADGATTPLIVRERYRRQALEWMRELVERHGQDPGLAFSLNIVRDLAPVRAPDQLAKLPPGEQAEWRKVWTALAAPPRGKPKSRELAPPPREKL